MKRGGKVLVSTTMLAVAACGGQQAKLEIRSTPTPISRGAKAVPHRIAEARGQLALGNVALAIEAFRMALRDDPNSVEAYAGMAECYDRMGRFDLSRRNYESALAIAPGDITVLGAFGASLQLQGRSEEAAGVRREIAARMAADGSQTAVVMQPSHPPLTEAVPQPATARAVEIGSPEPPSQAVTPTRRAAAVITNHAAVQLVKLPPLRKSQPTHEQPGVVSASDPARLAVSVPLAETPRIETVAELPASVAPRAAERGQTAALGRSATIKLPAARPHPPLAAAVPTAKAPVNAAAMSERVPETAVPSEPLQVPVPAPAEAFVLPERIERSPSRPAVAEELGPRLERLTLGEIALVTTPGPIWVPTLVTQIAHSRTLRSVPLRQASRTSTKVRLLNAARVHRLAARTREWLSARGWRGVAIGDARATRNRSVILYPLEHRRLAQRLSTQFGFARALRPSGTQVTVLLGTDAARHPALRRTGA